MVNHTRRSPAFGISLVVHIAAVAALTWLDANLSPAPRPHYRVIEFPRKSSPEDKIIWYKSARTVPDINAAERFGDAKTPQAPKIQSPEVLIARSADATSSHELIRQPDRHEIVPEDVRVPNLIAVPAPAAPVRKAFTAPPVPEAPRPNPAPRLQAAPQPDAPVLAIQNGLINPVSVAPKLPPKLFVAPGAPSGGRSGTGKAVDVPAPPPGSAQAVGGTGMNSLMLSLDPAAGLPPPGSRSGQFAKAPVIGAMASGNPLPGAPSIPDVVGRGKPGVIKPPEELPAARERKSVREIPLPPVNRTMSAPLRPSSRVIPAAVEAQFANRNVYVLIIPSPDVPGYKGDWVIWFSEREAAVESNPRVSAPVPARKYSPDDAAALSVPPVSATVQFAALIDRNGKVSAVKVLRGRASGAVLAKAVLELESWEFSPALHNGTPVDVDVAIEIPLQIRIPQP